MSRKTAPAPSCAPGERRHRGPQGGRLPEWVRPLRRVHQALDATVRLIGSALRAKERSERCAQRRPIQTSRELHEVSGWLLTASARLTKAAMQLAATNECIGRAPEEAGGLPEMLIQATERWIAVAAWLNGAANDVFSLHEEVLEGLETGALIPERSAARRPRIVLTPRPAAIRAFLRRRQQRVADRIGPLLRRRGRTPRPAALRVPRPSVLGRAPPLSPICLL
jgi:hypothetical protein